MSQRLHSSAISRDLRPGGSEHFDPLPFPLAIAIAVGPDRAPPSRTPTTFLSRARARTRGVTEGTHPLAMIMTVGPGRGGAVRPPPPLSLLDRQTPLTASVGVHDMGLETPVAVADERDLSAIR